MSLKKLGRQMIFLCVGTLICCFMSPMRGFSQNLPPRSDFSKRVAIIHSQTTANKFFDLTAYSQLFMAMQHQAMMAGIPFDVLSEDDLTDVNKIVNYDALIFPYFAQVPQSKLTAMEDTLTKAVNNYHIGIMTAGEFMTQNENGQSLSDPYKRMRDLLGVDIGASPSGVFFWSGVSISVKAETVTHPAMKGYTAGEQIVAYNSLYFPNIVAAGGKTLMTLAKSIVTGKTDTPNAVVATETGGRNVHFANDQIMADSDIGWSALQWMVYGPQPAVGLNMGRQNNIFTSRTDMDQSMFAEEVSSVEEPLYDLLEQWKILYNFVGSFHINIGNNPEDGEYTDWSVSGPLYQKYIALGHEIGTHSWTHPNDVNLLSQSQLQFEFPDSRDEIGRQLGITVLGGAVPGNAEGLAVDKFLNDSGFAYFSGRYSNIGSGYHGAFGYLDPFYSLIYFHISLWPDFTMIGFWNWTAQQAEAEWARQYTELMKHARNPIIHWMWHDYGPLDPFNDGYSLNMYQNTIALTANDNAEFATQADVQQRIKSFTKAKADVIFLDANTIHATITSSDAGKFCLRLDDTKTMKNVGNWYAYNQHRVFLPKNGGSFTMALGSASDHITHITALPMRADLISVSGDGVDLAFSFQGEGKVIVALAAGVDFDISGADSFSRNGDILEMNFNRIGLHNASIKKKGNQAPVVSLTSPANNAVFLTPVNITFEATATDHDGSVSQVEFFSGSTKLGEDTTSPYSFLWNNVSAGNYILSAKAIDNLGSTGTSSSIHIAVNDAPVVSLTAPADHSTFTTPVNITLEASASDSNGTVSKVEFFAGTTKLGEDTTGPYSLVWNNVSAGNYALTAKATDDQNAATTSNAVNITVQAGRVPTEVSFVSIAAEDGWVRESTETSNVGGATGSSGSGNLAIRLGDNPSDYQFKSIVSFDTSAIPDGATIVSAALQLTRGGTTGTDPFGTHGTCYVDIKNGGFNGNNALENSDFQAVANAQQIATMANQGSALGTLYTVNLNPAALTHINKTGHTQLRLYFSLDDNDDLSADYAGFFSADNSNAARHPKLVVKYTE